MGKKAILYARVSSDEQAEHGYSLPTQLEAMRKYATEHYLQVVAELVDDCSGTIRIYDRPQGKHVLAMLERNEAEALVFHTFDRLSRNLILVANPRDQIQATAARKRRANVDCWVLAFGSSTSQRSMRTTLMAAAVIRCCRCVLARPK
jgi:DNA invertase Pin-like site-specific DNA recombinase